MRLFKKAQSASVYFLLLLLTLAVEISSYFFNENIPNRDSGVFLYIGRQILDGVIPYRDVWDHKGPVIYYINALGLLIGHGSWRGVLFLEFLSLFGSVSLGFIVLKKAFGSTPALIGSIAWLLGLVYVIGGGNFTEEYGLPLSFLTLYLFLCSRESHSSLLYIFLIGACFSVTFLLKPSNIGMQLSVVLFLFLTEIPAHQKYKLLKQLLAFSIGTIVITAPVLLYLKWNNALNDFFEMFIRYNSIYSESDWKRKIFSPYSGLKLLSPSGLPLIVSAAWIIGIIYALKRKELAETRTALIVLALIGLPVEFILSSISGKTYDHYYISWLPVFAVLTGFFVFQLISNFVPSRITLFEREIKVAWIWILAILIFMCSITFVKILFDLTYVYPYFRKNSHSEIAAIQKNLNGTDYLLMWGAETSYNFVTGMKSPTRYVYQYPLYSCIYTTDKMVKSFLDDIEKTHPLIVDTSSTNAYIPPIDKNERKNWKYISFAGHKNDNCVLHPKMEEVFQYIDSRYKLVDIIEEFNWKIYKYDGGM